MPEVIHWNPRRRVAYRFVRGGVPSPIRLNNFGDLIGPQIVRRIRSLENLRSDRARSQRLLTVGSILTFAQSGDIVWGSGLLKEGHAEGLAEVPLDIRAVRGPATAQALRRVGHDVPDIYGDPALLIPHLWDDKELGVARGTAGLVEVPHWRDRDVWPQSALNPRGSMKSRVRHIASAELVISSSLHGLIIADAYGVPAVPVQPLGEDDSFKYRDYYEGTHRGFPGFAPNPLAARSTQPAPSLTNWSPEKLLGAFPRELWLTRH